MSDFYDITHDQLIRAEELLTAAKASLERYANNDASLEAIICAIERWLAVQQRITYV